MNKLRLLDILTTCEISGDTVYLPNTLQWLSWSFYQGKYLPKDFRPLNLVHLDLNCSSIVETPDISGMPNLEVLDLSYCHKLLEVHQSIEVHKKLVHLNLSCCFNLEKFPRIIQTESLEILDLSLCLKFHNFPKIHRNTSRLRIINLVDTMIEELPWSVGDLTSLQELNLSRCYYLRGLPRSLCGLEHLEIINLNLCSKLEYFFENPNGDEAGPCFDSQPLPLNVNVFSALLSLPSLRALCMWECNVSKVIIPESIGCIHSLQKLYLNDNSFVSLPESIGCLASLQELHLSSNNFVSLPESINRLSCLQVLDISDWKMLEALPELQSGIKKLDLDYCTALTRVPSQVDLLGNYEHLHHLSLLDCEQLVKNPMKKRSATIVMVDLDLSLHHNPQTDALQQSRPQFLRAFWDWRSVSNVLCTRQEVMQVYLPGTSIPNWFCQSRGPRVTVTLSPSWYNDKLRGFALCANAQYFRFKLHTACNGVVSLGCGDYSLVGGTAFWYIPISRITSDREWKHQKNYFLFEVTNIKSHTSWGIRLVYEGEVDEDITYLTITDHYGAPYENSKLKVCVARSWNHEEKEVFPAILNTPTTSDKPRFIKLFGRYI